MEDDPDIVDRMIDYLYRLDYDDQPNSASKKPSDGRLVTNSLVYALADKYEIWSLKEVAKTKIAKLINEEWNDDSFLAAVETAWTTTPQSDRGLRELFIPVLREHKTELITKEMYIEAVRSIGDLAVDMMQALSSLTEGLQVKNGNQVEFWCNNSCCRKNKVTHVNCQHCGQNNYIEAKR